MGNMSARSSERTAGGSANPSEATTDSVEARDRLPWNPSTARMSRGARDREPVRGDVVGHRQQDVGRESRRRVRERGGDPIEDVGVRPGRGRVERLADRERRRAPPCGHQRAEVDAQPGPGVRILDDDPSRARPGESERPRPCRQMPYRPTPSAPSGRRATAKSMSAWRELRTAISATSARAACSAT